VGTVFLVNAEEAGSRVAVLEGEVRVQQGTLDQNLLPGQQVTTSPLMTAPTLPQEIAWSRNAPTHLALLQQSALTGPQPGSARRSAPSVPPAERPLAFQEATQALAAGGAQQSRFLQVDFVSVDAIVSDASGQRVLDLRASDFKVFEDNVEQTVETFAVVNTDATPYYLLSYRSTTVAPTGSFRRISVRVDRPGVRVESRGGYFAGYYAQDRFSRGAYAEDGADLVAPVLRERREPSYPSDAIRARIQGSVVVEAVVGVDGRVSRSRVVSSLDKTFGLDDEALKAVSQWTFTPGALNGQKVPVLMRLVVCFRLH
jgi:TonB family protein